MNKEILANRFIEIREQCFDILERTTPVEWPERYRTITENSEFIGPWKNSNQPAAIKPLQLLSDPYITHLTMMYPAQMTKSTVVINYAGCLMTHDPQNFIVVFPNMLLSRDFAKKVGDMIRDTPILQAKFDSAPNSEKLETMTEKKVGGMELIMISASASRNLAARTAANVCIDELDALEDDPVEGDKVKVVENRTNNFKRKKIIFTSTPRGSAETSKIYKQYQNSLQYELSVKCGHCGESQFLEWEQVSWQGKGDDLESDHTTAGYVCRHCGTIWNDYERKQYLLEAYNSDSWVIKNPDFKNKKRVAVSCTQIHNVNANLPDLVFEHLTAQKEGVAAMIAFYNTKLATVFSGEALFRDESARCMGRAENYDHTLIPDGIKMITSGADVQERFIKVVVVGHYRDERWIIERKIIDGNPNDAETLEKYKDFTSKLYETDNGRKLRITAKCIDSRYASTAIHDFCSKNSAAGHIAVKGISGVGRLVDLKRKQHKTRHYYYNVRSDIGKSWLFDLLKIHKIVKKQGERYMHFPSSLNRDDYDEIFAEVPKIKKSGHFLTHVGYTKIRRANENLDCIIYAEAGAKILNPNWDMFDAKYLNEEEDANRSD